VVWTRRITTRAGLGLWTKLSHLKRVRAEGMGLISMKLVGEGAFTAREDRKASMRFAFNNAGVDCVTVGFKNMVEIDEAIENVGFVAESDVCALGLAASSDNYPLSNYSPRSSLVVVNPNRAGLFAGVHRVRLSPGPIPP
jgi:hypothetical protein